MWRRAFRPAQAGSEDRPTPTKVNSGFRARNADTCRFDGGANGNADAGAVSRRRVDGAISPRVHLCWCRGSRMLKEGSRPQAPGCFIASYVARAPDSVMAMTLDAGAAILVAVVRGMVSRPHGVTSRCHERAEGPDRRQKTAQPRPIRRTDPISTYTSRRSSSRREATDTFRQRRFPTSTGNSLDAPAALRWRDGPYTTSIAILSIGGVRRHRTSHGN
jgi:hypothetical protein